MELQSLPKNARSLAAVSSWSGRRSLTDFRHHTKYFKPSKRIRTKPDPRNVLIRVIVPPDEQIRNKIIRATNLQTPIAELSLHATDSIHFDIEEKLRLYQLFYERRKGEYRELRKPVDQIISIQTLARSVIAILTATTQQCICNANTSAKKGRKLQASIFR